MARLEAELARSAPIMAGQVSHWFRQLAQSEQPADYFKNPIGFPVVSLPWWLGKTLHPTPTGAFHSDLVYSTMNGYYYIRLLDNVMDGHTTVERELLPAAGFFHTQFQIIYQRYFEPAHPFWDFFKQTWFHSAEMTICDARLSDIDLDHFRQIASQKVCAGKIPLAAVGYACDRADVLARWLDFHDTLGAWHQLWNDVFDWNKDLKYGTRTYFLSEAERRKRPTESAAAWIVRQGFEWGIATLHEWLIQLKQAATPLNSPDVMAYLDWRAANLRQQHAAVADGLRHLEKLAAAMPASVKP